MLWSCSTVQVGTKPEDDCGSPTTSPLMPLPPYCPELNPVENVWQYLRQNELSFKIWDNMCFTF